MHTAAASMDEIMDLLDPPLGHGLTVSNISIAYRLLLQLVSKTDLKERVDMNTVDRGTRHARVQTILDLSNERLLVHDRYRDTYSCWLRQQADVYRALLVASYLWLELGDSTFSDPQHVSTLQSNMERAILLLQVLLGATLNSAAWKRRLPDSSYALLHAALQTPAPLIPLNRKERSYMYTAQRHRYFKQEGGREQQQQVVNGDDDDDDDDKCGEGEGVLIPDRRQLQREEDELLDMARKPIPVVMGDDHPVTPTTTTTTITSSGDGNFYQTVIHKGRVMCQPLDTNRPGEAEWRSHVLTIYACGAMILVAVSNEMESPQRHAYYLTQYSKCHLERWCLLDGTTGCLLDIHNCVPLSEQSIDGASLKVTLRLSSLEEGRRCMQTIHKEVCGPLQAWTKLQGELQEEWQDEYRRKCQAAHDECHANSTSNKCSGSC